MPYVNRSVRAGQVKQEEAPLMIAFMGYTAELTRREIWRFCEENRDSILTITERRVILMDKTRIIPIRPTLLKSSSAYIGYHFDQLILADDSRKMIYETYSNEIGLLISQYMSRSCVPEEYQIQFLNTDLE
jgi:hypothetical protein